MGLVGQEEGCIDMDRLYWSSQNKLRLAIGLFTGLILILAIFSLVDLSSRRGKVAVTIESSPQDSIVKINGEKAKNGEVYLLPGDYIFSAEKDGFDKYERRFTVSEKSNKIVLTPTAKSGEAKKLVNKTSQKEQQRIKDQQNRSIQNDILAKNPIMRFLPKVDVAGPYRVDYNVARDNSTSDRHIVIGISTPSGRQNAIKWLRSTGIDPTTIDIRYDDSFTNYLTEGVDSEWYRS